MQAGVLADLRDARGQRGLGDVQRVELIDHDFGLRDVHVGSPAGPVAVDQRGQRPDRRDPPHHVVGEDRRRVVEPVPARAGVALRTVGRPQPGDAGGGADQWAVTQPRAPRPRVAERAAFGQHDPRVDGAQLLIGKAQRCKGSRLEVGEHRVGLGHQAAQDLLALGAAQIQSQSPVIAVRPGEGLAHRIADPGLPQTVRVVDTFDFDDVGAQVAEQPAQLASGDDDAQIENPQPGKRIVAEPAR